MSRKSEELQSLIHLYRQETGNKSVDMEAIARWAMLRGVVAPVPKTPIEMLAERFAQAAREEHRKDPATGRSYRVNHAYKVAKSDGKQMVLWVELEDATRGQMLASLTNRRQQMVGDGLQLKIDESIWNARNSDEQPINLVMNFEEDIEERLNAPDAGEEAA